MRPFEFERLVSSLTADEIRPTDALSLVFCGAAGNGPRRLDRLLEICIVTPSRKGCIGGTGHADPTLTWLHLACAIGKSQGFLIS